MHHVSIKFDCGYRKIKMLMAVGALTVASLKDSVIPYYLDRCNDYIAKMEMVNFCRQGRKLFKAFILDGRELGGAQVSYAKKDLW